MSSTSSICGIFEAGTPSSSKCSNVGVSRSAKFGSFFQSSFVIDGPHLFTTDSSKVERDCVSLGD
jgi:hypothetical protein